MATTIVSTTRTTAVTLASGDDLLVSRSGAILTGTSAVIASGTGSGLNVAVDGEVTSIGSGTAILVTMT